MPVRLFVGNLPYDATEAELRAHFSAVGPLTYVYLPTDRESGKPRGFAFIEFNDRAQAEEAIRQFNNQLFKGRPITINEARDRESRSRDSAPSRPSPSRTISAPDTTADTTAIGDRMSRNFGPDAPPRRSRSKTKSGPRSERIPKGPLREVVRGQFFGGDEDDDYDDEMDEDNFASRLRSAEDEEEA
jgi:RNA recognition motif-containing protein